MNTYLTSDYHLDHANIIRFTDRQFIRYNYIKLGDLYLGDINPLTGGWISEEIKETRKQEMNTSIVKNHNDVVKEEDIVYHVGDFCFKGVSNAIYWENQLNGSIVHILGNHDRNNGVKSLITHAIMEFGGLIFYVTHTPPEEMQVDTIESNLIDLCDVILCGHVHNLWKHKYIRNKICVNIGIDVWNYKPVSINSILKYISKVKKGYV